MYVEAPEVLLAEYRVFDSAGRKLTLTTLGGPTDHSANVQIQVADESPTPQALADLLRRFLESLGLVVPAKSTLEDLIWAFGQKAGFTR